MAKAVAKTQVVREVFGALPYLRRFPSSHFWVDYDKDADVLYVSFDRPQRATDSILQNNNVLLRYRGKKLVGVTVIGTRNFRVKV